MKKLFFFRSSSNNGNDNDGCMPSTDKQVYWDIPVEDGLNNQRDDKADNSFRSPKGLFSKSRKQVYGNPTSSSTSLHLRRSRSMSSAAFVVDGLDQRVFSYIDDQIGSPSSSINSTAHQRCDHPSRRQALTPERQARAKRFETIAIQNAYGQERPRSSGSSKSHHNSSGNSSCSNISSKVLDRYIDGEEQQERSKPKNSILQRNFAGNGNEGGKLPPRVQYTAPSSPPDGIKDKHRSRSYRDSKAAHLHFFSRDWVENGFNHESPRRLAKDVIERLSQTHLSHKSSSEQFNHDIPITIEDIYAESMNKFADSNLDVLSQKSYSKEEPHATINNYHGDDLLGSQKTTCLLENNCGDINSVHIEDAIDVELQRRSKEAEERVLLLSEELDQEGFQGTGFDIPSLIQNIRNLMEDRLNLAIEVSGLLNSQISERDTYREEVRLAKAELEARTRKLQKEKSELQSALERELDRRSSDWSLKLEKYQLEEQRLRARVRELAEQNVSLQREVSSFNEREEESRSVIAFSEQQLRHLTSRLEEASKENHELREDISELRDKHTVTEGDLNCTKRNFEEKDKECKELQKSTARLLRTCNKQEKTIEGLREAFGEEIEKQQSLDKFNRHLKKLQMEQLRLTGSELALRRELESQRIEIDSLRQENVGLLSRLKGSGEDLGALTFKLDKEMWSHLCFLKNQGLPMLKESTQLCSRLLEFIKGKAGQIPETKQGGELTRNGLDGQFVIEADVRVQGFKCGIENLTRSLQTLSSLLQEKSSSVTSKFELPCPNVDGSAKLNNPSSEETLKFELKAEILLTSLLREKLYTKDLEVEQLQAELAAAVRGNDILKCEVQNALDNLSRASHKLKDFELQMQKKDDSMSRLQNELQESMKELTITRGILPKVSEERDLMWEKVKQYNEKNMLLNSEVSILKKKIEALDEDLLLKEGQITILKDTIGTKPFDLLASPDYSQEFLLK